MGDPRLLPVPPQARLPADVFVISSTFLGYFNAIPWSGIAAMVAGIYTCLLIIEKLWTWARKWRRK